MIFVIAVLLAFADIAEVKSEPDLDKRSELALANADRSIDEARKAYTGGDEKATQSALNEVAESVDLSYDSLKHTHSAPRKSRYYKRAELKVQLLLRRLRSFRDEVAFDSRQSVETVINKLTDLHDQLITDIMSKKKNN